MVEPRPSKPLVAGSSPVSRSCAGPLAQRSERPAHNRLVLGSNPRGPISLGGNSSLVWLEFIVFPGDLVASRGISWPLSQG
jgi:hypothetical protein